MKTSMPFYSLSDLPGGHADDGWPEKQMDIKFLLKKDEWSTSDILSLFDEKDTKVLVFRLIKASVVCEKLSFSRSVLNDFGIEQFFFKPDVILNWLMAKELELPEQVLQWQKNTSPANQNNSDTIVGANSQADIAAKKRTTTNRRKRKDNLTKAIEAAIKSFRYKPSLEELWQFFLSEKDETGFIQDSTDEKITWMDTKGNFHDTTKKALANRLTAY